MNTIKRCCLEIDQRRVFEMILGIVGINISFLLAGIVYEKITNEKYLNN
jgi:hypothetical protein